MESADFRCSYCGSDTKTLNVHHRFYRKGAEPWDYELEELICLCDECHEFQGALDQAGREAWGLIGRGEQERILGHMLATLAQDNEWTEIPVGRFAEWNTGAGICKHWGIDVWRKYPECAMNEIVSVAELNIALWEEPYRAEQGMIDLAEGYGR